MRFHHSTRRGRTNRFGANGGSLAGAPGASGSRRGHPWSRSGPRCSQMLATYCRETNIHFNRRICVDPPQTLIDKSTDYNSTTISMANNNDNNNNHEQVSSLYDHEHQQPTELDRRLKLLSLDQPQQPELTSAKSTDDKNPDQARRDDATGHERLSLEAAREKLVGQVQKHPLWSTKAAKRMELTSISERFVYIYELVSFCERRHLEWRFESYRGGLASRGVGLASPSLGANVAMDMMPPCPATPTLNSTAMYPSSNCATTTSTAMNTELQLLSSNVNQNNTLQLHNNNNLNNGVTGSARCKSACDSSPQTTGNRHSQSHITHHRRQSSDEATLIESSHHNRHQHHLTALPDHQQQQQANKPSLLPLDSSSWQATTGSDHNYIHGNSLATTLGYTQRPLPSPENVWAIEAPERCRPRPFTASVYTTEVPQSSFVKSCHGCQGRGRLKCSVCFGIGYEVCLSCSGKGVTKSSAGRMGGPSAAAEAYSRGDSRPDHASFAGREPAWGAFAPASSSSKSSRLNHDSACRAAGSGGLGGGPGSGGVAGMSLGSMWSSESCHYCHGAGHKRCMACAGKSYLNCVNCLGLGQLRCFLSITISWLNHRDEGFVNNPDNIIPRDRLRLCGGQVILDQAGVAIDPFDAALAAGGLLPVPAAGSLASPTLSTANNKAGATRGADVSVQSAVNQASRKLVQQHKRAYAKHERLLSQRHKLTQIECHVVNYEWKKRRGHFVVYGTEQKVYIAKYPFKSICNIT